MSMTEELKSVIPMTNVSGGKENGLEFGTSGL